MMAGPRLLEMADPARVQALLRAPNVRVILQPQAHDCGTAGSRFRGLFKHPPRWGRPQKLTTNIESTDNPPRVWTFKRLRFPAGVV